MQKTNKLIKVSAISYINTYPFLYGLENAPVKNQIELSIDIPSKCAEKLLTHQTDLGLAPVAVLNQHPELQIISDYCIGSHNTVKTVILAANCPLQQIKTIYLDYQSKTSIALVQILCKNLWKINPVFLPAQPGYEKKLTQNAAGVIIGDRVFYMEKNFDYVFDLVEEWYKLTALPFVFAAWIANKPLADSFVTTFNEALNSGIQNIDKAVDKALTQHPEIPKETIIAYYEKHIDYSFDKPKKEALKLFLEALNKTTLISC